jgi:hypothetical protein
MRTALRSVLALTLSLLATMAAQASVIHYQLVLSIDQIEQVQPCNDSYPASSNFGCRSVGEVFVGGFGVDDSILTTEGVNHTASIYDFFLPFGTALYSTGADNLTLFGFRNPFLGAGTGAPAFLIEGGEVVDLIGGVFASGDLPSIDFSGWRDVAPHRFDAFDFRTHATGTLEVFRVPEPGTLALAMIALVLGAQRTRIGRR